MTTQKQALATIKQGGQIQNTLLFDDQGYPKGQLTAKQVKALLSKGLTKTVLFDQTVVIK
ncbi:hypothetical protein [Leptothoe sp. PORK10 BA2]|uniref:hypothetical protein n=1 Tax=Leptothoe sp. PORK10 BA2 TaxID=3110254 RepID=UPI002B20EA20|nr:hypothetical protein [Leptothoe sp. PORK10 BA2]MEA5464614.1 hypothetical protein [Leptothoe sp. PORK10 BA2]